VNFPSIGTIDLDAPELPSNDQKMLDVATKQMFANSSFLDTIVLVASALRQDEGAGGSAPPAAPEAAEGVPWESAAGTESVIIAPPPTSAGEGMGTSLPLPVGAATAAPAPSVVSAAEGVVGEVGPSSPRLATAAVEEVPVPNQLSVF
jgi:hypothetical protein